MPLEQLRLRLAKVLAGHRKLDWMARTADSLDDEPAAARLGDNLQEVATSSRRRPDVTSIRTGDRAPSATSALHGKALPASQLIIRMLSTYKNNWHFAVTASTALPARRNCGGRNWTLVAASRWRRFIGQRQQRIRMTWIAGPTPAGQVVAPQRLKESAIGIGILFGEVLKSLFVQSNSQVCIVDAVDPAVHVSHRGSNDVGIAIARRPIHTLRVGWHAPPASAAELDAHRAYDRVRRRLLRFLGCTVSLWVSLRRQHTPRTGTTSSPTELVSSSDTAAGPVVGSVAMILASQALRSPKSSCTTTPLLACGAFIRPLRVGARSLDPRTGKRHCRPPWPL